MESDVTEIVMYQAWIAYAIVVAGLMAASSAEAGAAQGKSKIDTEVARCKAMLTAALTPACRKLIDADAARASAAGLVEQEAAGTLPPPKPSTTRPGPQLIAPPPSGTTFAAGHQDCDPLANSLFVRADPLDNFHYLIVPPSSSASSSDQKGGSAASAKGASISYTNDHNAGTQTATVNGRLSFLAVGEYCGPPYFENGPYIHGFGIAPFVDGNGTWNEPVKKTSTSSLQAGVDFVAGLEFPGQGTSTSSEQYLYLSPYHQTDFRNVADINGVVVAWEPQVLAWRLGVATKSTNPYIDFFWQLRAQAQWSNVSNVGYTNLTTGNHEVVGDILRLNIALLPGSTNEIFGQWMSEWVVGRFSLIGTMENFRDFAGAKSYEYYSANLSYKLGACVVPPSSGDSGSAATPAVTSSPQCAVSGSSSLSFEYDWGTDINTLVTVNQYVLKLSYAY